MSIKRTTLELVIEDNQVVGIQIKEPAPQPVIIDDEPETVTFRMGVKTRRRAIELLSNAREGFTIEQLGGFLGLTESSVHTLLTDLRNGGTEIEVQPSPYGGRRRAYRIA
tara:strand:- start:1791 stop:2120 length:330 start_codon:yes stop_codon:yes gene_type:complete